MKPEIKKIFRGDMEDDEKILAQYSHDASLLEVRPKLILFPKDAEDVKNLVKWVGENQENYPGLSITPRSAGTDMSGGAIGESLILDFTRYMNKLVRFTGKNITIQPGMFYRDFEQITLEKGLILPCYTASKSLNAMGGMYGNNSAGERTLKYGKTEDYIFEAKVVFSDGNEYLIRPLSISDFTKKIGRGDFEGEVYKKIYQLIENNRQELQNAKPKVHKNSAGYYIWNVIQNNIFDLNKLLVGSQGTLGIVTEITFKLLPDFKYSKLVVIFLNDLEPLGRLVDEILTLRPETLEAYDQKTMKLAVRFFPDFLKSRGLWGMFKFIWSFLPEFWMMLGSFWGSGLPKLILLVEFAGENDAEVSTKCLKLQNQIRSFRLKVHITKNQDESGKYWDIRRESFALLRKHVKGKRTAPFIDDVIVRPEFLPKFLPELDAVLSMYDLTYTIAGHAGDGNFHIIPLMDFSRPDTAKIIMELSEKVYDLVSKYRGSITAEHNDGIIRTPYLSKIYDGKTLEIFRAIKNTFDPKNIFNPGKKIPTIKQGGTKEYIATHIALEHHASHHV